MGRKDRGYKETVWERNTWNENKIKGKETRWNEIPFSTVWYNLGLASLSGCKSNSRLLTENDWGVSTKDFSAKESLGRHHGGGDRPQIGVEKSGDREGSVDLIGVVCKKRNESAIRAENDAWFKNQSLDQSIISESIYRSTNQWVNQ